MIIDFHAHTFPESIVVPTLERMSHKAGVKRMGEGTLADLEASMMAAGTDYSVNLPVMTKPSQVHKVNEKLLKDMESYEAMSIIPFGGIHPDYEDYKKELKFLKEGGIQGIKIHPAYQNCDLTDIRNMRIIDEAAALGLTIVIHAGIDIGLPDRDYASVDMITEIIDEIGPSKFVLAHMGGWGEWKQVESDLAGAPVYMDTAFSVGDMHLLEGDERWKTFSCLTVSEFERLCRKHGTDKILFGTDYPWGDKAETLGYIQNTGLSEEEKQDICYRNALKLIEIKKQQT